jgi:hypothetical protein
MSGRGAVVDGVDEAAEAAVVATVWGEDEAWEVGEGFLVSFLRKCGALGDGAGFDEIGEVGVEAFDVGVAETALEADDEFVSDEAIGMEDSVEVFEFVDGFFDVVGDAEEGEVVFGDEAAGEEFVAEEGVEGFPVGSARGVDHDEGEDGGFAGLDEGEDLEALVHGAEAACEEGEAFGFLDEG